jgi:trehalose 6-phosphate phosphatase
MVVELRPPIPMDKGRVVARLAEDLDAAWFFGDDIGDVPAFIELHRRAAVSDGRFSALAVGVGNDTPVAEVAAHADVLLAVPALVVELLRHLRAGFGS